MLTVIRMTLAAVVLLGLIRTVKAGDPQDGLMDRALAMMAKEIKSFLAEQKLPSKVIVGDFSGDPKLKASGGVEIRRLLLKHLEAAGVGVADDAETKVMGKFKLAEKRQHPLDESDSLALEVRHILRDRDGNELVELVINVFGSVGLQISGASGVEISPKMSVKQCEAKMIEQVKNPPTSTDQGKTKPSATSPFSVEILVVKGNQLEKRPATLDQQKRAYVDLHQREQYVVRIHNAADFEAAVALTIDGVDMFVDATDAPADSLIIVAPGKYADVPGWYISKTETVPFSFNGYFEGSRARFRTSTEVGTITAAFQASWDRDEKGPADDLQNNFKPRRRCCDLANNNVFVARNTGILRAVDSVRYDR
jgi:hypothetical protein